jgi:hypothetical protein
VVLTAILHAQTFWAIGKNHVGRTGNSARTMKQAITELRAGWYGDTNYWDWVYAGKPTTDGDGGVGGKPLSEQERIDATMARKGKTRKTKAGLDMRKEAVPADDWVPGSCHAPANCRGLVEKIVSEADAMIARISGLSGTVAGGVTVEDGAKLVDRETRNTSDLTGVNCVELLGNDVIVDTDTSGVVTVSLDSDTLDGDHAAAGIACSRCPAM